MRAFGAGPRRAFRPLSCPLTPQRQASAYHAVSSCPRLRDFRQRTNGNFKSFGSPLDLLQNFSVGRPQILEPCVTGMPSPRCRAAPRVRNRSYEPSDLAWRHRLQLEIHHLDGLAALLENRSAARVALELFTPKIWIVAIGLLFLTDAEQMRGGA